MTVRRKSTLLTEQAVMVWLIGYSAVFSATLTSARLVELGTRHCMRRFVDWRFVMESQVNLDGPHLDSGSESDQGVTR